MPRSASAAPRNMFPPPTTAATCTPALRAWAISSARCATTSGEMPRDSVPAKRAPESLTTTRPHGARHSWLSGARWSAIADAGPVPGPASGPVPGLVSGLVLGLASGLADLEPGERPDGHAVGLEDLSDALLGLLHESLLHEHDILVEAAQPALDDPRDSLLRLALLARDLLRDPPLLLGDVGRHIVAGDVLRTHSRDLLRQVLGHILARLVQLDEHAEGRRQVTVGAVQVAGHVAALEAGVAAELQLLLDSGASLLDELLHRLARLRLGGQQRKAVSDLAGESGLRDLGSQLLELLVLGHEVGLAVQLDHDALGVAVKLSGDQAVPGGPGGALARVLDALEAKDLDGLLEVAVGFRESVLAVHHSGAGLIAQPLHISGGEIRHVVIPRLCLSFVASAQLSPEPASASASATASAVAPPLVLIRSAGISGVSTGASTGASAGASAGAST